MKKATKPKVCPRCKKKTYVTSVFGSICSSCYFEPQKEGEGIDHEKEQEFLHPSPPPSEPQKNNFLQNGRTIACGACDNRFEDCKELAKKFPTLKPCDCICHDTPPSNWKKTFRNLCNLSLSVVNPELKDIIEHFIEQLLEEQRSELVKQVLEFTAEELSICRTEKTTRTPTQFANSRITRISNRILNLLK